MDQRQNGGVKYALLPSGALVSSPDHTLAYRDRGSGDFSCTFLGFSSLVPRLSDGLRGWLLESLVRIACACAKLTI